jgi:hypothetical protein
MLLQHTYVAADAADATQGAAELSRFYSYFGAWFHNKKTITQGLMEALTQAEMQPCRNMRPR